MQSRNASDVVISKTMVNYSKNKALLCCKMLRNVSFTDAIPFKKLLKLTAG